MPPGTLAVAVQWVNLQLLNNKQTNSENYVANSRTKHLQYRATNKNNNNHKLKQHVLTNLFWCGPIFKLYHHTQVIAFSTA